MLPGIEIRRADRADVPAIRSLLAAHGNDGPVIVVDVVGPYVAHLIDHHRAMVTDGPEGIVAFGAVVDAGVATHLADLFVLPDRLGQGIGRPLLAALFGSDARRTTFASRDPRALPLYVRAGMSPLWAGLYVAGASTTLPAPPANVDIEAADPARMAAIELAWTGVDRSVDHTFWGSQGAADSFVIAVDGEVAAIAHARARQATTNRIIDRLVVRPGGDPVVPTLAALRRAGRGGVVDAFVPGPSPVLRALLDLGFLVTEDDQYMASATDLVDAARLLPNPGML
jgi:GNAT superfamily N-acetyltransferase